MSSPEDEPLGGKPVLPPPSQQARDRAHPLFNRILSERGRADAPAPMLALDEPTRAAEPFLRTRFESGRSYDATLAFIQATAGPIAGFEAAPVRDRGSVADYDSSYAPDPEAIEADVDAAIDSAELARLDALYADPAHGQLPARPPPFVPMVRPSPPKRPGPAQVDEAALSAMVDTSLLIASPDGSASFEIAFDDDVFRNLACSITVTPAGVVATFKVDDPNTRRLLEAEAGRLRVQLAERGLKVADVRVEMI